MWDMGRVHKLTQVHRLRHTHRHMGNYRLNCDLHVPCLWQKISKEVHIESLWPCVSYLWMEIQTQFALWLKGTFTLNKIWHTVMVKVNTLSVQPIVEMDILSKSETIAINRFLSDFPFPRGSYLHRRDWLNSRYCNHQSWWKTSTKIVY